VIDPTAPGFTAGSDLISVRDSKFSSAVTLAIMIPDKKPTIYMKQTDIVQNTGTEEILVSSTS
jgi:hypothetical protein